MRVRHAVLAVAMISLISPLAASAGCDGIPESMTLTDGNWLVRVDGVWQPVSTYRPADTVTRTMSFAYVARDDNAREGLIVIKSGSRTVDGPDTSVKLTSRDGGGRCDSRPAFAGGEVAGNAYDRYHDYSYSVSTKEQKILEAFHLNYAVRGGCKRSNDDSSDSYFTGRWQSNRSQFSFDPTVVEGGQFSQFAAQFGPARAFASNFRERRVEVKSYATADTKVACVPFTMTVKPNAFIRIVDLEKRSGVIRAAEQVWPLP